MKYSAILADPPWHFRAPVRNPSRQLDPHINRRC